jgi:MoaD family protein
MHYNTKRESDSFSVSEKVFSTKKQINKLQPPIILTAKGDADRLRVTVEYLGYIKQTLGITQAESVELGPEASASDLLVLLAEKHGEAFRKAVYDPKDPNLKPYHIIAINGLMINLLGGLDTKLKDGDRVAVMPVVTGG